MTDNLQEFLDDIDDIMPEPVRIELDGFSKVNLTLCMREPDAGKMYETRQKLLLLINKHPMIEAELLSDVSSLIVDIEGLKQSGTGERTSFIEFIRKIAMNKKNPRLWHYILGRCKEEFAYTFNNLQATESQIKEMYKECGISDNVKFGDLTTDQLKQLRVLYEKKVSVGSYT
jgi:hypothetical protein